MSNDETIGLENIEFEAAEKEYQPPMTKPCDKGNPKWTEYVMGRFQPEELINDKYPTLDGLRRVAFEEHGEFIVNESVPVKAATREDTSVTIKYILQTQNGYKVSALADATPFNCTVSPFSTYLTTIAENRAEARALRKLLRLKVVAWDEMVGNEKSVENIEQMNEQTGLATANQVTAINVLSERFDIDVKKLVKSVVNKDVGSVEKLLESEASTVMKLLNEYNRNQIPVPDEIKL